MKGQAGRRPAHRRGAVAGGQALVELTLALPVLLVILLGVADTARALAAGVLTQNAAKQAAVLAARHYVAPLACVQPQAQQLVSDDLAAGQPATVALTQTTPPAATQAYTGEVDVQATVDYSFTFVSPWLSPFGSSGHPLVLHALDAEHVLQPTVVGTSTNAGVAASAVVTRTLGTDGAHYVDGVTWQMPAGWTPGGQTFRVFQSPSASDGSFADACPVGATVAASAPASTSPATYTLLYDLTAGDTTRYNYWVVAYAPATPPGQVGAAGTPMPAIRQ